MSGNDTLLHLPNGDFETLREENIANPRTRRRTLELMLEPGNFGRAFPCWLNIAQQLRMNSIRNTALCRAFLRARLRLSAPA